MPIGGGRGVPHGDRPQRSTASFQVRTAQHARRSRGRRSGAASLTLDETGTECVKVMNKTYREVIKKKLGKSGQENVTFFYSDFRL